MGRFLGGSPLGVSCLKRQQKDTHYSFSYIFTYILICFSSFWRGPLADACNLRPHGETFLCQGAILPERAQEYAFSGDSGKGFTRVAKESKRNVSWVLNRGIACWCSAGKQLVVSFKGTLGFIPSFPTEHQQDRVSWKSCTSMKVD